MEPTLVPSQAKVTTAKHRKVDEVAAYIINHCTTPLSLDSLAKRFYVGKCYLSRIFKEVTGFTIIEYIAIHRLQRAQHLLLHSDHNISEISEMLGFESITYFERVFKNYMEVSPLKYRKYYKP
jgi:YesN/AraC family two-component response regulator